MIDENNFKQALFDYTIEKYGERLKEFYEKFSAEFPEREEELDEEFYFKNFLDWLMIEKVLPEKGKTILEEFVESHPELENGMKEKMLGMKNVIRSEFEVLSKEGKHLLLKDKVSGKEYRVKLDSDTPLLEKGSIITGRIHPFGDCFRFAGIFRVMSLQIPFFPSVENLMKMYEADRISDAEKIVLYENSRLTAILNKYPFQWVDGICKALSIDTHGKKDDKVKAIASKLQSSISDVVKKLPENSKKALRLVLEKGGFVKRGMLKDFNNEIGLWWNEYPPNSDIGILRLNGLLAIGRMPMSGRMYSVALIPFDLRELLKKNLGKLDLDKCVYEKKTKE
jgi:hypothetical protein